LIRLSETRLQIAIRRISRTVMSPIPLLSQRMENYAAATDLNYFSYNFIKIHRTLRTSAAMATGVQTTCGGAENLVALWEANEQSEAA
jgi:hypothetical protein